jgi:uncharacterized protein (DUF302 family)
VVDLEFEAAVGEASHALREEGMHTIARIDVRDHFWRDIGHDFRHYLLLEAWSADLALEALRQDLDVGGALPTTFAIYELADGKAAVVASSPLLRRAADPEWRRDAPALAAIADREAGRVDRVLGRIEQRSGRRTPASPAA